MTSSIERVKSNDVIPEHQQVLAESTPPRTPTDLKELVTELQSVTPIANQSDSDSDGLYDSVELVIGTNVLGNDTDSDLLDDYVEIMVYGTDPLLPDSNDDEFLDYDEVSVDLDLDEDGIPNAWDFDNDGDGVNDFPDLSPNAKSVLQDNFNITIQTEGEPTFITFQLVPENPEHMKFLYQTWDWLDGDDKGLMQDLDDSTEDIYLEPVLNLITDDIPSQDALSEFGLRSTGVGYEVPLSPMYEFGNIVAFNARVLYLNSEPLEINLQAELRWEVVGNSDVEVNGILADGNYVSTGHNAYAIANVTEEANASSIQWLSLDSNEYAIKLLNGPYLTIADTGILLFNSTNLGDRETFVYSSGRLTTYDGKYVMVNAEDVLETHDSVYAQISFPSLGVMPETTTLVKYTEPFILSGLTVEHCISSEIGVYGNTTDNNQTIAAQWVMDHLFVNNATTTLSDMPALIADQDVEISYYIQATRDRYDSLVFLNDEVIPLFLQSAPAGVNLPVILAMEDTSRSTDLSDLISGSYILQGTCTADIAVLDELTTKTLRLNWFNSSTYIGLNLLDIAAEVISWQMDANATYNMLAAITTWNRGTSQIARTNGVEEPYQAFDLSDISIASTIVMAGLETIGLGGQLLSNFRNWKTLSFLMDMPKEELLRTLSHWKGSAVDSLRQSLTKNSKFTTWLDHADSLAKLKSVKFAKYFKLFDEFLTVIGILVDVAFGIAMGWKIADQIGGDVGRTIGALYGTFAIIMAFMLTFTMYLLVQIPFVGWLMAIGLAIADAVGNYSSKMVEVLVEAFFGRVTSYSYVTPSTNMDTVPTVTIVDPERNGLDVGDGIFVNGTVWSELDVVTKGALLYRDYLAEYYGTDFNTALQWITNPSYLPGTSSHINFNIPLHNSCRLLRWLD
ncbi:MAG: fascin domain-containing protein [Candidatus Thorarchaeota archaeon]